MKRIAGIALAAGLAWAPFTLAQDHKAAEATLKKDGCLKCHSVSAEKDGPSYKSVAAKYKGNKEAHGKLAGELKKGMVGDKKHAAFKGSDADLKQVVDYILSR